MIIIMIEPILIRQPLLGEPVNAFAQVFFKAPPGFLFNSFSINRSLSFSEVEITPY